MIKPIYRENCPTRPDLSVRRTDTAAPGVSSKCNGLHKECTGVHDQQAGANPRPESKLPAFAGSVTSVWLFWTAGSSLLSRVIRRVTGQWSHMGIGFGYSAAAPEDGRLFYYESLFASGVVGPKPYREMLDWLTRDTRRRMHWERIYLTPESARNIHRRAHREVGRAGYGKLQLGFIWLYERLGKRIGMRIPKSPHKVICSEYVARCLSGFIDLTDELRTHPDMVTPTSAYHKFKRLRTAANQPDQRILP